MLLTIVNTLVMACVFVLAWRSGYRFGYRDAISGRRARIPLLWDDEEE